MFDLLILLAWEKMLKNITDSINTNSASQGPFHCLDRLKKKAGYSSDKMLHNTEQKCMLVISRMKDTVLSGLE